MATLYTFGPSHFCEKARWALDLCALDYEEVRWAPGPHLLAVRGMAPETTVPILRTAGTTIQGSGRIIDWLETSCRPGWQPPASASEAGAIAALEAKADEGIGVTVRRLAYAMSLPKEGGRSARHLFTGVVWWQRPLARAMWPITRQAIMKGLKASANDLPEARNEFECGLDRFDALLADGRRFLVGERFTRADIALASLISPVAHPAQHPVYPFIADTSVTRQLNAAYGERPSVRWAKAIYRDFRTLPAAA